MVSEPAFFGSDSSFATSTCRPQPALSRSPQQPSPRLLTPSLDDDRSSGGHEYTNTIDLFFKEPQPADPEETKASPLSDFKESLLQQSQYFHQRLDGLERKFSLLYGEDHDGSSVTSSTITQQRTIYPSQSICSHLDLEVQATTVSTGTRSVDGMGVAFAAATATRNDREQGVGGVGFECGFAAAIKLKPGRGGKPNRILLVTIHQMLYPITVDVLHQVFEPHGCIEKIVIFQNLDCFQALIQFRLGQCAISARTSLQGRDIYDDCCRLDIQYSNRVELQVHYNDEWSRDFTNMCLPTEPKGSPSQHLGHGDVDTKITSEARNDVEVVVGQEGSSLQSKTVSSLSKGSMISIVEEYVNEHEENTISDKKSEVVQGAAMEKGNWKIKRSVNTIKPKESVILRWLYTPCQEDSSSEQATRVTKAVDRESKISSYTRSQGRTPVTFTSMGLMEHNGASRTTMEVEKTLGYEGHKVGHFSVIHDINLELAAGCGGLFPVGRGSGGGNSSYILDGVPRMMERPIGDLVDGLKQLGAELECTLGTNCPPDHVRANGSLPGGKAMNTRWFTLEKHGVVEGEVFDPGTVVTVIQDVSVPYNKQCSQFQLKEEPPDLYMVTQELGQVVFCRFEWQDGHRESATAWFQDDIEMDVVHTKSDTHWPEADPKLGLGWVLMLVQFWRNTTQLHYHIILVMATGITPRVLLLGWVYCILAEALGLVEHLSNINNFSRKAKLLLVLLVAYLDACLILWISSSVSKIEQHPQEFLKICIECSYVSGQLKTGSWDQTLKCWDPGGANDLVLVSITGVDHQTTTVAGLWCGPPMWCNVCQIYGTI